MGKFSEIWRKVADFLSDADRPVPAKTKPGIQALAAKRLQALQASLELVEAQLQLASQSRRELQRMVAEAKAVEGIGKQALLAGELPKAEAAMARYAALRETLRQMTAQAQAADRQAAAVAERFRAEAEAAQQAAVEAKALSQLENIIELQKKHQALTLAQSAAAEAFEAAREKLLLSAAVQAASLRLQGEMASLDRKIEAGLPNAQAAAVGQRWQTQLAGTGEKQIGTPDPDEDPADSAIRFLERPPLGGPSDAGPQE
jgi:hypothetical protein